MIYFWLFIDLLFLLFAGNYTGPYIITAMSSDMNTAMNMGYRINYKLLPCTGVPSSTNESKTHYDENIFASNKFCVSAIIQQIYMLT